MTQSESEDPKGSSAEGSAPLLDGSRELGPYRLLSVLGEGGMGIVYLADQTSPIRRRVAIKVLKLGMDTEQVVARFESERQALAVMDHPNIADVFDSGVTSSGRPYFVMEVVHGTPITDYADTHRLNTAERIRLFLRVCSAVQHAHQKGVIHRDLKPSNVLVAFEGADPTVKVIDFGVAKAIGVGLTDRTLVTRMGQQVGTPEYMSPEQAEMSHLDVDTRTDVYSLGVMLYELIVGTRPFDLSAKPGYVISHTLREEDTPRPSTKLTTLGDTLDTVARHRGTTPESLRRELKGDLDWIILKAMAKDRTHRYDTVNGLAMDLMRHLDDEPVLARPPSTGYRLRKFVRRNRAAVLATGVAMAGLIAGGAAATVGLVQAVEERERAEQAAATAERVSDFLVQIFQVSEPGEAGDGTITARQVLDQGAAHIGSGLEDQPGIQATLLRVMAEVYGGLGLHDDAVSLAERAVALLERSGAGDGEELARSLEVLGTFSGFQGRWGEAESALDRALGMRSPGTPEYASVLASSARVYLRRGRLQEVEPLLREALAIYEAQPGPDGLEVGRILGDFGSFHLTLRDHDAAEPYLRRSLAILERGLGPDHAEVAGVVSNLGAAAHMRGDYAEAEPLYTRAYRITERSLGPDHFRMTLLLHNLGETDWAQGRLPEAEERLNRALVGKEQVLGADHPSVGITLRILGNVKRDSGRYAEAESNYRRAIEIYERSIEESDPRFLEVLEDYGELLRRTGRNPEAESVDRRVAAIRNDAGET